MSYFSGVDVSPMPRGRSQQAGLGSYDQTGNWSWEFYPPPYDFLAPRNASPMPAPILYTPGGGLSGCHCAGRCGGSGCGEHGMGLFDSGLDLTQWGLGEWSVVGVGLYLAGSLFGDLGRARKRVQSRRGRSRRASNLRKRLSE